MKSGASKSGAGLLSATAAALICAVAMAGCASSTSTSAAGSNPGTASSTSATPTPSTSVSTPAAAPSMTLTPPPTAPPACPTSGLQVKLGQSSGYAGGVYVPIDFTNTSQGCAKPVQTIFIAAVQAQGKAHPMISASGTAQ